MNFRRKPLLGVFFSARACACFLSVISGVFLGFSWVFNPSQTLRKPQAYPRITPGCAFGRFNGKAPKLINLDASFMKASGDKKQLITNPAPDLKKAGLDLLREGLRRSYKERFLMATRLYKVQLTMKKAIVTHKQFISK
jgi:hypothetical protein